MDDHLDKFKVYHAQLTADVLVTNSDTIKKITESQEIMERKLIHMETKTTALESSQENIEEKYGREERKKDKKVDRYAGIDLSSNLF